MEMLRLLAPNKIKSEEKVRYVVVCCRVVEGGREKEREKSSSALRH